MEKTINRLALIAQPYVEKISNEVQEFIPSDLGSLIEKFPEYKEAFRALSIFSIRVSRITNGILDLILADNLYSTKILERSLIEHTFKIEFLVDRSLQDKTDSIFKEYFLFCDLFEEIQYQNNLNYKAQKLGEGEVDLEAYQDLISRRPELINYSRSQISEKANQFTFRNIFRYLNSRPRVNVEPEIKEYYGAYLHYGAIYSDLSSFVHAGPFADKFEFRITIEEEHDEEVLGIVETAMVMHFISNLIIVSFLNKLDSSYHQTIEKIVKIQADYYKLVDGS